MPLAGTAGYMAPELRAWFEENGEQTIFDHSVDNYSVGMLIYFMVSSLHAVNDESPHVDASQSMTNVEDIGFQQKIQSNAFTSQIKTPFSQNHLSQHNFSQNQPQPPTQPLSQLDLATPGYISLRNLTDKHIPFRVFISKKTGSSFWVEFPNSLGWNLISNKVVAIIKSLIQFKPENRASFADILGCEMFTEKFWLNTWANEKVSDTSYCGFKKLSIDGILGQITERLVLQYKNSVRSYDYAVKDSRRVYDGSDTVLKVETRPLENDSMFDEDSLITEKSTDFEDLLHKIENDKSTERERRMTERERRKRVFSLRRNQEFKDKQ